MSAELKVEQSEMNDETITKIKTIVKNACKSNTQESSIAINIREELTNSFGTEHWHCVVGKSFGSSIYHEATYYLYLSMGQTAVLIFKT